MTASPETAAKRTWSADDPRRKRSENKREAILEAALEVFLSEGFSGTSMERVATVARVSKMTVYRHFEDKEALFLATMNRHCDQIYDVEVHPPALTREEARQELSAFGWTFVKTVTEPDVVALWRMLLGEVQRFPQVGVLFYDVAPARTINVIERILSGILLPAEARLRAGAFMHMLLGDTHQRLILGKCTHAEAMQTFGPQLETAVKLVLSP